MMQHYLDFKRIERVPRHKDEERDRIRALTAAFLEQGGAIKRYDNHNQIIEEGGRNVSS